KGFGESGQFTLNDEWYSLRHLPDDLHVILVQVTKGMQGPMYHRPNYPMTWARSYGKGRVFYTSMGHREDVWENPKYQGLLIGALAWAAGKVDANIERNIKQVTPGLKASGDERRFGSSVAHEGSVRTLPGVPAPGNREASKKASLPRLEIPRARRHSGLFSDRLTALGAVSLRQAAPLLSGSIRAPGGRRHCRVTSRRPSRSSPCSYRCCSGRNQ